MTFAFDAISHNVAYPKIEKVQNYHGWYHEHYEDLAYIIKAFIKFGLKILLHKCQCFRDHLTYIGLVHMLKEGKSSYVLIRKNIMK